VGPLCRVRGHPAGPRGQPGVDRDDRRRRRPGRAAAAGRRRPTRSAGPPSPAPPTAPPSICSVCSPCAPAAPSSSLDVRRAALATGHGRSTMHRAFGRLVARQLAGSDRDDRRPRAHPRAAPRHRFAPCFRLRCTGWDTRKPAPPRGYPHRFLSSRLQTRLAAGQADVFAYGRATATHAGGLGHHAGRVYQQLIEHADRSLSLAEVCQRTGYRPRDRRQAPRPDA
jgi:hypothetical protein